MMDDPTLFDRQIAAEFLRDAGPSEPVDDLAIYEAVMAANRSRRWGSAMFSALRFIAAAAIVALFGGFLLTGVLTAPQKDEVAPPAALTESPSPLTTEAFLASMVTEEVQPGVLRIISDGYRALATPSDSSRCYPGWRTLFVGDNGHIWRAAETDRPGIRLYQVGQEAEWDLDPASPGLWANQVDAGPDGRLWALEPDAGPRLFDDGAWVPDANHVEGNFSALAVQADGTVWLLSDGALHWTSETSAGSSDWLEAWEHGDWDAVLSASQQLSVTDDGVAWLMTEPDGQGSVSLLRFDGTAWQIIPAPAGVGSAPLGHSLDAAPDGSTLWVAGDAHQQHQSLARLDGEGWTIFTAADGVGTWGGQKSDWDIPYDMLRVAPDGSAWVDVTVPGTRAGDGLARFDGETWQPFLSGSCVSDFDVTPDGYVWVVALDTASREVGTYVITPEAVATLE